MKQLKPILLVFLLSLAMGCKQKMQTQAHAEENTKAVKMLQGVWVDGETLEVNFMIKGDSIFYPDSTSQPARFKVVGDSLVIGEDDEAFKVHVHTNIPGEALTKSQQYGTLELAKIENMRTQHEDILAGKKAQSTDDLAGIEEELEKCENAAPQKRYGVVAICAGDGMTKLFSDLGADAVVTGGQTMNPSTEDILREIERTPAETVFVLPNNKNIIMAAEQCIPLCEDRQVVVIPTKTVPQGITAMLNYDESAGLTELQEQMSESIQSVRTAQVTYAARDSVFDGHTIKEGEYLALLDGKLVGSYKEMSVLMEELGKAIEGFEPELVTLYYGQDVDAQDANDAAEALSGLLPEQPHQGRDSQPVYRHDLRGAGGGD